MDRVGRLVSASSELRRRIWASLPFSVRLAEFFYRVAVSTADAFGEAVYTEFLKHDIEGMPDINGEPASKALRVPRGYGREFGKKAYMMLMSRFHSPQFVEEVMADFLVRFLSRGSQGLRPGASLKEAENYVLKGLTGEGLNALRKKREVSDIYFSDGEEKRHDISVLDEDSVEEQLNRQLPKMNAKLKAIHPDAPLYVKLSIIDGYSDREIIGDVANGVPSMLTTPYSRQGKPMNEKLWQIGYKSKILDVLKSNFDYLQVAV